MSEASPPRDAGSPDKSELGEFLGEEIARALDPDELRRRGGDCLAQMAADAAALCERRLPGEICVRVANPGGARSSRTVAHALVADQPFVVDTIRLCFRRLGHRVLLLLHPLLPIERESDGQIAHWGCSSVERARESWVYVEIPRVPDAAARAAIERELASVLADARAVVADHTRMVEALHRHTAEIRAARHAIEGGEGRARKLVGLLDWLADENFIFLGYRHYRASHSADEWRVEVSPGSGLGVLREAATSRFDAAASTSEIPPLIRSRLDDHRVVYFDKSKSESRIHRQGRLDSISVKTLDPDGRPCGYGRFVGLLTFEAIRTRPSTIPILAERLDRVLAAIGAEPGSHTYKVALEAYDSLPVEMLFPCALDDVVAAVRKIVRAAESLAVGVVAIPDPASHSFFVTAIVPRPRYDEDLRRDVGRLLRERCGAARVDHRTSFLDEDVALIHFFCSGEPGVELSLCDLERDVGALAARWEDRFEVAMQEGHAAQRADRWLEAYRDAFPLEYRGVTAPSEAVLDVERLEQLASDGADAADGASTRLRLAAGRDDNGLRRLKIYQTSRPYLTDLLPVLDHFGLRVIDALLTEVAGGRAPSWIVTFRIEPLTDGPVSADLEARLLEGLAATLDRRVDDDSLNALILGAGLSWRSVHLLRAYLSYSGQLGAPVVRSHASEALLRYPSATRALLDLFRARFDPEREAGRAEAQEAAERALLRAREPIATSGDDRVFAILTNLIESTQRTSFFREDPLAGPHVIALKLDSSSVRGVPAPIPFAEIFVHSAHAVGVHLRGGRVARGGVRFSDRLADLRGEVLDLLKTQSVKNGLIVPLGAKGGFALTRRFDDVASHRAEAEREYRRFIGALLAVTDDVRDGCVIPPERVVCHDGEDPYLVVAPDRGTAHLSDLANEVASESGFWLGDAFASGGSRGYDHKKAGITARGAWVCARRHFLEAGLDVERDSYDIVGIGDMSGDVFGNGLLLARRGRLRAAFDRRWVFLDPSPDPEVAWQERRRLFALPASSWADYDSALLSPGGGVYERSARRVSLSREAQSMLDIDESSLSGEELVRAVLRMPADLLWNGGIGTYVKAAAESDAEVGDRANAAVRVDAAELGARVVVEGGNLGLTQLARVECALRGVRLNTDSLDNSGGVDLSDHEVNFKILMARATSAGELSAARRDELLAACLPSAIDVVLAHSSAQSRCVSLDRLRSAEHPERTWQAAGFLIRGGLDPRAEFLPTRDALAARTQPGHTRPELSILLGHTKRLVKRELLASELCRSPALAPLYESYFPRRLRGELPEDVVGHPLRAEITATCLANRVIDCAGVTLVPELCTALGCGVAEVVAACYTADLLLSASRMRAALADAPLDESSRLQLALGLERCVRGLAAGLLGLEGRALLEADERVRVADALGGLSADVDWAGSDARRRVEARAEDWVALGLAPETARELCVLPLVVAAYGIVGAAHRLGVPFASAARIHAELGAATRIDWLLDKLRSAERGEGWSRSAAETLEQAVLATQCELATRLLADGSLAAFLAARARELAEIERSSARVGAAHRPDLAALTVLAHQIRRLRPLQ